MTFTHTEEVKLAIVRCGKCGRFYALEQFLEGTCPYCKHQWVADMEAENARPKRSNAALRGHRGKESGT